MSVAAGAFLYNAVIVAGIWVGALVPILTSLRRSPRVIVSFSAGVFLGVAFLHMIPEAIELYGPTAGQFVLFGYLAFYALERFTMVHACDEHACDYHHVGPTAFLGLSIHSVMNGVALGSALLVPGLGLAVFVATLFHKLPEAFSLSNLLLLGNRRRSTVFGYLFLFSAMVPAGTLVAMAGIAPFGPRAVGIMIALSAGIFLQIATGDLLKGTHSKAEGRVKALVGMLVGAGLSMAALWME